MKTYLIILTIASLFSCKNKEKLDNCLESFLGKPIEFVFADQSLSIDKVNVDSTEFSFYFNKNSNIIKYLETNKIGGAHDLLIKVSHNKIQQIVFNFISVGDPELTQSDVEELLSSNFCFNKPLISETENKLSKNSIYRDGRIINATYFWNRGIKGIIEIEYNLN